MSDLTDEQLEYFSGPVCDMHRHHIEALIAEVRRHRAAQAPSYQRIMAVVEAAVRAEMDRHDNDTIQEADWVAMRQTIAVSAAAQLASPAAPDLTPEERAALRRVRLQGPKHERTVARAAIDRLVGGGK